MTELITKRLLPICVAIAALFGSLYAHGEAVDNSLAKVTIVVDGMMKSKSGATWMSWPAAVIAALSELASVTNVDVNLETDKFTVIYDPVVGGTEQMLEVIVGLGFKPKIAPSRVEIETDTISNGSTWAMPQLLVSALLEADETRKLVLIYFFAEWCGACKTMEKTTFKDPTVIDALKRFVFVKIDTGLHPATAKHFNVVGMPTLLVLDNSGKQLYWYVGPIGADKLSQALLSLPGAGRAIENN